MHIFFFVFLSVQSTKAHIYSANKREITKHDLSKHLCFIKLPDCHMELASSCIDKHSKYFMYFLSEVANVCNLLS